MNTITTRIAAAVASVCITLLLTDFVASLGAPHQTIAAAPSTPIMVAVATADQAK